MSLIPPDVFCAVNQYDTTAIYTWARFYAVTQQCTNIVTVAGYIIDSLQINPRYGINIYYLQQIYLF